MKQSQYNAGSTKDEELTMIRSHLLSCQGLDPNCEAMQLVLAVIDDVQKIIVENGNSIPLRSRSSPIKDKLEMKMKSANIKCESSNKVSLTMYRLLMTDLPLVFLFLITVSTAVLSRVYQDYLGPQLDFMEYTDENRTHDLSYYHRVCPLGHISTNIVEDLYIGEDFTTDECVEHMMVHGMSLYKDIIQPNTAQSLREYILEKNKNLNAKDAIGVIANKNRWSFGIGANDHPSVSKALNEIATNRVLRPALEKIAGDNPAMIEMTAITAGYGATEQFWHPDIIAQGSPAKYARSFVTSYALFITLQVSSYLDLR